jgi:hypothetical protein
MAGLLAPQVSITLARCRTTGLDYLPLTCVLPQVDFSDILNADTLLPLLES